MNLKKQAKKRKYQTIVRWNHFMKLVAAPLGRYRGYAEIARSALTVEPMNPILAE